MQCHRISALRRGLVAIARDEELPNASWLLDELMSRRLTCSQYLPLREFGGITNALNFSTPDYHVIGGCDIYTTKAAGGDKKLYKNIEESLESQYESLVRLSASLSPPRRRDSSDDKGSRKRGNNNTAKRGMSVGVPEIYLSRASPFGPLSQISARRTFAYLIATLNASHPDYDFSHTLRPDDFRKERSLRGIMQNVDTTLMNLRPRSQAALTVGGANYLSPPSRAGIGAVGAGAEVWSPKMWDLIDKEMGLRSCEKYSYAPEDDPFDEDEGCIWSLHYFFFSKERRRVCYLYLRGLSVISHSPVHVPLFPPQRKKLRKATNSVTVGDGAGKRASYWLGSKDALVDAEDEGDDDEMVFVDGGDDEVDEVPYMDLDEIRTDLAQGFFTCDVEGEFEGCGSQDDDEEMEDRAWRPRGVSEGVMEMMEL